MILPARIAQTDDDSHGTIQQSRTEGVHPGRRHFSSDSSSVFLRVMISGSSSTTEHLAARPRSFPR